MSGLALVAHARGATVSGSDVGEGPFLARLRAQGIPVAVGHAEGNVPLGAEMVVSSAVPPDNVERRRGRALGLREHRRGDLLVELTEGHRRIAVAGTHGKTTTAAMIVHVLRGLGEDVNYVVGGDLVSTGLNAEWVGGDWVVLETDESDRSLLALAADVAVVTNVEWDHVEEFDSLADVEEVFGAFLARSALAVVWDRPEVRGLRHGPVAVFDAPDPELSATGSRFSWRGHDVELRVLGAHNARNAAAALEACAAVGADPELAAKAMQHFAGVGRRLEHRGTMECGAVLYDDYAHHPSAIAATLAGAATLEPEQLVVVLRLWGRARTRAMASAYGEALQTADLVLVVGAPGGTADADAVDPDAMLVLEAASAAAPGRLTRWISDPDAVGGVLSGHMGTGSVCVTIGCRDVAEGLLVSSRTVASAR
jgi:UDP-N-acetylmuramate--alanine ligase